MSVIRQKGESQNGGYEKLKHKIFQKMDIFDAPIRTHTLTLEVLEVSFRESCLESRHCDVL